MNTTLVPRHLQLRSMLFRRWKTVGVKIGDRIESQNDIVNFCGFSLITVIKTLKDLEAEGVIRRQVGKGSFLVKTPWAAAHWRIGMFYNRDIVGGGIFNNEFYTKLVVAFEKSVVSDGHEFILGSFTHKVMPITMWDALDAVVLTGITSETSADALANTSSQISVIDTRIEGLAVHSYRLDFEPAIRAAFGYFSAKPHRWLYLDSEIASPEQTARLSAFKKAHEELGANQRVQYINVNQESGFNDTAGLIGALEEFRPNIVCGYVPHGWHDLINQHCSNRPQIYGYALGFDEPGFVCNTRAWMDQMIPSLQANLENRQAEPVQQVFPATFNP
ncbi:hypothetical protein PSQ19_18765 [Devosia algicola]|uniref:HTH gntR-type domain-containing protein n=1 Tax=Devosia algicola TaxID=3026418 RepID=A0ABY7YMQ8_9HYPH|nr:hypothetical protein [Devosia algicola]WDR02594.1 hypothetical protein PSQ19_18765 [Devosia algicola]